MPDGHRHFGEADREAAVGQVVHGGGDAVADEDADEVADLLLVRRGRPAAACRPCGRTDRADRSTGRDACPTSRARRTAGSPRPRRQSRCAPSCSSRGSGRRRRWSGSAGCRGRWSRCRARRCPKRSGSPAPGRHRRCRCTACDQLAHDLGPLGVAEVEIVGRRERIGADSRQVAPALGDRLLAALVGIGLAIARRHVGREGQRLGRVALDADDAGIAARPLQRIALDQRVVLLVDPAPRARARASRAGAAARRRCPSAECRRRRAAQAAPA